ncbi:hypothetical protein M4D70_13325, partial [Brevibacillus borstelensis]|uniref:hypothetical protein n=1 Tax=Brevibacillus borstelensis TaxID=45462 RepID=UPI002040DE34
ALSRAFKDRDHEKVTHPTGGLIFAMVVNFLMSTVVNILIDIHILHYYLCHRKLSITNIIIRYRTNTFLVLPIIRHPTMISLEVA